MEYSDYGINLRGRQGLNVRVPCPTCSPSRKKKNYPCLNVNTAEGVWFCHHCGWTGSLGRSKQRTFVKREYIKPTFQESMLPAPIVGWFSKRGITNEILLANKISVEKVFMPQADGEVDAIAFPYVKGGEIVNIKYRDRNKNFRQVSGAEKTFYGYDRIGPTTIICEGEMDALSLQVAGFENAISVPDGAPTPNAVSLETKFEYLDDPQLDGVEKFILAVDNDAPGKRLEEELSRRLGRDRCWRVTWPSDCKDANEVLVKHGKYVLQNCIDGAQPCPIEGLFQLEDFFGDLDNIFENGLPEGLTTGWKNVDEYYRPIEGQWTLVTGIPGMGKSEWLDALAVNLAQVHGWVFGVCSPENQPVTFHATKLMEKYKGKRLHQMNREEYEDCKLWLNTLFKFILPEERSLDEVLNKTKVLVRRYGLKGLIIDPYNELGHTNRKEGVTETEYISEFLGDLRSFARDQGIHVWLVAHPKMMRKESNAVYPVPTGYDVAGSAHFFNKADNIVAVHRDKADPLSPVEVHVQKIRSRWLGKLGTAYLNWDPRCGRFDVPPWTTHELP